MKKHKVVLFHPKTSRQKYYFPLALLHIGSILDPEKYEVVIIDEQVEQNYIELVRSHIDDAVCLGVSAITGKCLKQAIRASEEAKDKNPNIKVIWGGWHASLFSTMLLKDVPSIDLVVQGQGEITFKETIESIVKNGGFKNINGLIYREGEEIIKNPPRAIVDMNTLPAVNYDLVDAEKYFTIKGIRQLDYFSSIGCVFRCEFCADPKIFNRKWNAIKAPRMYEELSQLTEKYNLEDIQIQDECFFIDKKRTLEFAKLLLNNDTIIPWEALIRVDQAKRLKDDEFELLIKSGFKRVYVGVEAGSQKMLDWMKKDIKIEQVYEFAERCNNYNIFPGFSFIVGFPNESIESIKETLRVAVDLQLMNPNFRTFIFHYKPFPGSPISDEAARIGFEIPKNTYEWSEFESNYSYENKIDKETYELVENVKYSIKLLENIRTRNFLISQIIRWRLKKKYFKHFYERRLFKERVFH